MVIDYVLNSLLCFNLFLRTIKKKLFFQVKNFKLGFVNYLC
jgi:hypothetical protein